VKRMTYAPALLAVLAIAFAGCGDGGSAGGGYGGGSTTSSEGKPASSGGGSGASIVSAAQVGDLGTILVTAEGLTLYDFHKDQGGKSACYGACAGAWPPLLTDGQPRVEGSAQAGMLGTTKRKDGTVQVTYNGWPLYTYVGDRAPGDATGNDIDQFSAEWYALQPNGEEPED
jgi:predicted lipoprotein with Yx(FWY)xxD motif